MCNCIETVNAKLVEHNAMLKTTFYPFNRPLVETMKTGAKRGKPPAMIPTYCPFCGVKYEPIKDDGSKTNAE